MTDTSSLAITHATTDSYPVTAPLESPAANGAVSDSVAPDEEEPYTIKCICQFDEDDGSTVFCEGCETWQHIVCYYPDKRVPDVHNCVGCEPRQLDSRRATDRQRQRRIREKSEDGDRKNRRSGAKSSQKKKINKEGDVNGFRSESSARDQPPSKKAKISHRASSSISALAGTPTFPPDSRKRRSSTSMAVSPTKFSGPSIPLYSNEFMHLYDQDDDHVNMDSNLFVNVSLVGDTALWLKDPNALAQRTGGHRPEEIFTWSDVAMNRSQWPTLTTETITDPNLEIDGRHPMWKILKTQNPIQEGQVVGEITGKVGHLRDYCLDPNNRWAELRHPEPFVFFHSHLPITIDSRHEGSILRYIRRSCKANATLKIFITNDVEYHFCFVAKENIPANSEITTMWYLEPQLSVSSDGLVKQESGDSATEAAAVRLSNALANFGGCACDPSQNCLLATLDRRRHPRSLDSRQANGKRKKKTKSIASPLDTGRASNSRAGSETTKHPDEDDPGAESRSTSGSARGQPRSRDLSPSGAQDAGAAASELSSRERRKIADAEKQFQQLEQDQGKKKKKRPSGPSAGSTPAAVTSSTQTGFFGSHRASGKSLQLDTGHSRSPTAAVSPMGVARHPSPRKTSGNSSPFNRSPLVRPVYVDAAVQADVYEGDEPPSTPDNSRRKRGFVPMTVRLLKRYSTDRLRSEEIARQKLSSAGSDSVAPADSPSSSTFNDKPDVAMMDAEPPQGDEETQDTSVMPESESPQSAKDSGKPPIPPPWPSTAAHNTRIPGMTTPDNRGNLRVSMPPPTLPPMPLSVSPGSASTASLASPTTFETSSPHSAGQPPLGSVAPTPTPAKKKLSLGDYLIRRGTMATTPTSEKSQAQANAIPAAQKSPSTPGSGSGPVAGADNAQQTTPTKSEPDDADKNEPSGSPDVSMKDATESTTYPPVPSVS
ncbi:hypothetical protein N7474_011005 [Penicillium riverlandense]|uniref:uncharacterized protein n=1 Tax=Penicillium riverlandense TaxID=1903569 RepID=UPI002547B111|nr:uncharacterized protein N7474_011005 [Penicillium riverlandense]KAJ5805118.1 hypothetical protein N7474_011005 [Penicillium riverlandense]